MTLTRRAQVEAHIKATPIEGSPVERRAAFRRLAEPGPAGAQERIGGVACRVFGAGAPVVWLHGGGYMFGDGESHAACAAFLAEAVDGAVIVPEYRCAPEHLWPAPQEDALAVLAELGLATPLVGDSAGGHLALVLATQTQARPRALALISPNTDRTGRSTTRRPNTPSDLMNADAEDARLAEIAFGDRPAQDPEVSPLLGPLDRLPPLYLAASRAEVLAGDAALLEQAARARGVAVTARWYPDLFHMWTLWPRAMAEARETLTEVAEHIRAQGGADTA
ncbi:alpha/beta hydrolase [Dinoroseobacter sp. S375]|uniref:alpha/beta hydrolase n=1 Tax=Dinoroseobacter sp. S375 TaxID=3415136 RepID=UPI003C7A50AB